jgi:hypothetical protein
MNQIITAGRTGVGTSTHDVPAGSTQILDFQATTGAVLSGDPNLTYALIQTPTANAIKEFFWVASGFYNMSATIPVAEGRRLYVAMAAAGSYIIVFDGP